VAKEYPFKKYRRRSDHSVPAGGYMSMSLTRETLSERTDHDAEQLMIKCNREPETK
jgi:hypothetical protein